MRLDKQGSASYVNQSAISEAVVTPLGGGSGAHEPIPYHGDEA